MNPFEVVFGRKVKPEGTGLVFNHCSVEFIGDLEVVF